MTAGAWIFISISKTLGGCLDIGLVAPYIGNHLVDPTAPEFQGTPSECTMLKLPEQYAETGYYPTKYCTELDWVKHLQRYS
jgi:hypothetical protein